MVGIKAWGLGKMSVLSTDFFDTQKYVYEPLGWKCNNVQQDAESKEYCACSFEMNDKKIIFRVAKITPTKIGQFVLAPIFIAFRLGQDCFQKTEFMALRTSGREKLSFIWRF